MIKCIQDLNFENWELQQSANIQFTLFPMIQFNIKPSFSA